MARILSTRPEEKNANFDQQAYHKAAANTLAFIQEATTAAELTYFSNRPIAEVEALQEEVAAVIPAGNIVGLVLSGLVRLRSRHLPADQAKSDVSALLRGIEMLPRHILPSTIYGTFFVGPAAVLAAYQKLLTLAGKEPDSAFPEGLWQFYLEFALREDSARHANETTGFQNALSDYNLKLSPVDQLAAWVCAVSQIYFQYDDLLYNEWRERVYLNLLEQAAKSANRGQALAFRRLPQAWAAQRPYQRGQDAHPDENYPSYRRRRFDKFLQNRLETLPLEQRNRVQETYAKRVKQELDAYQQQMTILSSLEPDRYRENRVPIPLWQTRIGVIFQGRYYLLPPHHTDATGQPVLFETRAPDSPAHTLYTNLAGELCDQAGRRLWVDRTGRVYDKENDRVRGYLQPASFQAIRRQVAAILNRQSHVGPTNPLAAQLDDQLIAITRPEQERARKLLLAPAQQELKALKCAPVIINWDEQDDSKPLVYIRKGKRGIGDHPLTIFRTATSTVFDQSHIYFDGTWGMALAEILTNEAVAWAAYFNDLTSVEPAAQVPYHPELAAEPALKKFSTVANPEVSAESPGINLKALYELLQLLIKRNRQLKLTVNDVLLLYRCEFNHEYRLSPDLEDALFKLKAQNNSDASEAYHLITEMLIKFQATNPCLMIPMDATATNPRERLYPTTFRNPFTELWSVYQMASKTLQQYTDSQTQTDWALFNEARSSLMAQLYYFGEVLRAYKNVALEGGSTSTATLKLLAHLPDSFLKFLDEIPRRIDVLNEVIKGEEVFSNVGRVARGSSLSRFISAKDDNENKTLVWGILTDDQDTLHLSLRDFRPYVATLYRLNQIGLAELMVKDYLEAFVTGFNQFVARLLEILESTSTHTIKGVSE